MTSSAVEHAVRMQEFNRRIEPYRALLHEKFVVPLMTRSAFLALYAKAPKVDHEFAVLRSVSPVNRRRMTTEKRWKRWHEMSPVIVV